MKTSNRSTKVDAERVSSIVHINDADEVSFNSWVITK